MMGIHWGALIAWSLVVAWHDWRYRRIPNVLSLGAWLPAGVVLCLTGQSWLGAPWPSAMWASLFGLGVTLPGYALRKLGAGDVKFLVAIGLFTSWQVALTTFMVAGASAGMFALAWLNRHHLAMFGAGQSLLSWLNRSSREDAQGVQGPRLPFGLFLSLGLAVSAATGA